MIVNGKTLFAAGPLRPMLDHKARAFGVSHGLTEAGYDIRVKQDIRFVPPDEFEYWRLMRQWERATHLNVPPVEIMEAFHGYVEVDGKPTLGRFALASSIESFQMPTDLVGLVKDKSTWARQGLSVFNTVVEPGWIGDALTLELVYHGKDELHIPAGSGIAQILFERIEQPAQYTGKYQHQEARPVSAIMEDAPMPGSGPESVPTAPSRPGQVCGAETITMAASGEKTGG